MLGFSVSVLLAAGPAAPVPTVVPPMFYSEIVKKAKVIAQGTVTKTMTRYERGRETIVTYVTFSNLHLHKGKAAKSLTLRLVGGSIGDDHLRVPLMPQFKKGKRYLVYVDDPFAKGAKISPIVGFYQGAFEVVNKNGRQVLISMLGDELIGVQKDRFVFAAKPAPKIAIKSPRAIAVPNSYKPAAPNVSAIEEARRAQDLARARAQQARVRLASLGLHRGNAPRTAAERAPGPVSPRKIVPTRKAEPIVIQPKDDNGFRMSASSLASMTVGGK